MQSHQTTQAFYSSLSLKTTLSEVLHIKGSYKSRQLGNRVKTYSQRLKSGSTIQSQGSENLWRRHISKSSVKVACSCNLSTGGTETRVSLEIAGWSYRVIRDWLRNQVDSVPEGDIWSYPPASIHTHTQNFSSFKTHSPWGKDERKISPVDLSFMSLKLFHPVTLENVTLNLCRDQPDMVLHSSPDF